MLVFYNILNNLWFYALFLLLSIFDGTLLMERFSFMINKYIWFIYTYLMIGGSLKVFYGFYLNMEPLTSTVEGLGLILTWKRFIHVKLLKKTQGTNFGWFVGPMLTRKNVNITNKFNMYCSVLFTF